MTIQMIPVSQLTVSSSNVRKTMPDREAHKRLMASIASQGVLQNLVVVPQGKQTFGVVAGGRRLRALKELVKHQILPADFAVPCRVTEQAADAAETAVAEASEAVQEAATELSEAAQNAVSEATESIASGEDVATAVEGAAASLADAAENAVSGVGESVEGGLSGLAEQLRETVEGAGEAATDAAETATEAAEEVVADAAETTTEATDAPTESAAQPFAGTITVPGDDASYELLNAFRRDDGAIEITTTRTLDGMTSQTTRLVTCAPLAVGTIAEGDGPRNDAPEMARISLGSAEASLAAAACGALR